MVFGLHPRLKKYNRYKDTWENMIPQKPMRISN